jgi:hypothetical protein
VVPDPNAGVQTIRMPPIWVPGRGRRAAVAALPVAHHLAAASPSPEAAKGALPRVDVELTGDPVEAILAHVDGLAAPLVVMSGHGHSGWTKRLVGSVAEQVVRRSKAPVVVVGPQLDRSLPLLAPRTLLVAVGSPPVPGAMVTATAGWATTLRSSVVLAHVVSPEVAAVADRSDGGSAVVPDLDAMADELLNLGLEEVRTERLESDHPTRALVELSETLAPPVLLVAQAHAAEDVDQSDQITYKLLQHSRWPILATVGRS